METKGALCKVLIDDGNTNLVLMVGCLVQKKFFQFCLPPTGKDNSNQRFTNDVSDFFNSIKLLMEVRTVVLLITTNE